MTIKTLVTGFPRMGKNRELKKALENYWSSKTSITQLLSIAKQIRIENWTVQKKNSVNFISSNDFSLYDNMLDTAVMLNAIPQRFIDIEDFYEQYFAMARGTDSASAMEMTKWFNTNYHYIVPELEPDMHFRLNPDKIITHYKEALKLGVKTKINIIGPLTFLACSKTVDNSDPFDMFGHIIPLYEELLELVSGLDNTVFVQIEEPVFVKDCDQTMLLLLKHSMNRLTKVSDSVKIIFTTYFDHAVQAVKVLQNVPLWGIGLDFVHGDKNIKALQYIGNRHLVAGVIDGRNIWRSDYYYVLNLLKKISLTISENKIIISTACSLLHVPYSTVQEPESLIKKWLAFSLEKLEELKDLACIFSDNGLSEKSSRLLENNAHIFSQRQEHFSVSNLELRRKLQSIKRSERSGSFKERNTAQKNKFSLPPLPLTTIGSFPQTLHLRKIRRQYKKKQITQSEYTASIEEYIEDCIRFQEEAGLDVLVHGEPERNDMVEYFGEKLNGFHITENGWVQSYGSRCVKPPVIYGDVSRPEPMTLKWILFAAGISSKPVKGMLTGPVTILNWSFVRTDLPRSEIALQIAAALSDEIDQLQRAGIKIIQVDEAAFKEGYPLRKEDIEFYEFWAVKSFKLAVSKAFKTTQIHTHMCYSEFNDIIHTIEKMDADVITIETARSGNELLQVFNKVGYSNEIGPGVYDIHSPAVPSVDDFLKEIKLRLKVISKDKMWINPDCGLKTRKWPEVKASIKNMVAATRKIRG